MAELFRRLNLSLAIPGGL